MIEDATIFIAIGCQVALGTIAIRRLGPGGEFVPEARLPAYATVVLMVLIIAAAWG